MSQAMLTEPLVTASAFEGFLDSQRDDSLLVADRVVAMTNPSEIHEKIASNIGAPLAVAMNPKGCHVYQGGIGVERSDHSTGINRTRPDVVVQCGCLGTRNFITDALVGVESTNVHRLAD